ncbi:unnamed protein product [Lupinus luteus]|uniref:Uncharacterized protein n=1 Tax=Lupinus luteus TaxID=3873 RepID=A0AAV1YPY9_LUPLU
MASAFDSGFPYSKGHTKVTLSTISQFISELKRAMVEHEGVLHHASNLLPIYNDSTSAPDVSANCLTLAIKDIP